MGICKTKCSFVHHLSTKAFLWPLDLGHASHSFVFTSAIFSLPACTLTVQLYKAATLATMNWSQHFTLQSQLLFRCENLAGYWLKMRLFTFNFSTKCSLVVVKKQSSCNSIPIATCLRITSKSFHITTCLCGSIILGIQVTHVISAVKFAKEGGTVVVVVHTHLDRSQSLF